MTLPANRRTNVLMCPKCGNTDLIGAPAGRLQCHNPHCNYFDDWREFDTEATREETELQTIITVYK